MKIALTGGSGFIGRHVLKALSHSDADIVVTTRKPEQFSQTENIKVVELDIGRAGSTVYHDLGCPDVLIHLAWGGLPNYRSTHHFDTELPAQYQFLRKMIEGGLPALVVSGTCFEYGMQSGELCEEIVCYPQNPYGFAKDALRRQLEFLNESNPFIFNWARLFYMYGHGMQANSLYSQLKAAIVKGEKTFNMSGGEQLRDYLPVEKVALGLVKLSELQASSQVTNICSGIPISIRQLVEGWIDKNGWDIELNLGYYPYPDYEPMAFWGSNKKMIDRIGSL